MYNRTNGSWSPEFTLLKFTVLPPWWQQSWFILLCAAIIILFIIYIIKSSRPSTETEIQGTGTYHLQGKSESFDQYQP